MASLPDIKAAFIQRLEASTTVTAQTTRIAGALRKSWTSTPGKAIVIRINGSPGIERWYEVGMFSSRLDIEFYGASPDQAYDLWLNVHPVICPGQGSAEVHGFTQGQCRVAWVELESGPFELIDTDVTNLPFTQVSYVAVWAGVPVS